MKFVMFIGNDRVGKTTMSKSLRDLVQRGCRYKAEIMSFGDGVREELIKYYGIPRSLAYDKTIDKDWYTINMNDYPYDRSMPALWAEFNLIKDPSLFGTEPMVLRDLYVNHSTHIRRVQNSNYWVDLFIANVEALEDSRDFIIVDDARFDTEFAYLLRHDYLICCLTNDNPRPQNAAQDSINQWIAGNADLISDRFKLDIPLLNYSADQMNIRHIIPKVTRSQVPKTKYLW